MEMYWGRKKFENRDKSCHIHVPRFFMESIETCMFRHTRSFPMPMGEYAILRAISVVFASIGCKVMNGLDCK